MIATTNDTFVSAAELLQPYKLSSKHRYISAVKECLIYITCCT